jgi:hypothetical protein
MVIRKESESMVDTMEKKEREIYQIAIVGYKMAARTGEDEVIKR